MKTLFVTFAVGVVVATHAFPDCPHIVWKNGHHDQ
jgi:hypothetical protein